MTEERKQELRQLLNEAIKELKIGDGSTFLPINVYRVYLQQHQTFYWVHFNPYIVNEGIKSKLLDFIRAEFAPFISEDKILSASFFLKGGPGNGFPLDDLLAQLLKIAVARGIEGAVSAFDKCTKETHGSVQYMVLLEGIKLKTEIQVFEGIRLVPLPSSTSELPHYLPNISHHTPEDFFFGKTVLIVDCSAFPIFCKPFGPRTIQEDGELRERTFRVEINSKDFPNSKVEDFPLNFLCQALSFACNSPVQISLVWNFLAVDELYNLSFGMGGGFSMSRGPFRNSNEAGETQIDEAKRLYHILVSLDSNVGEKLQIAVDRWIQSGTNKSVVDRMIDLGVAFESIYLSEIKEKTELSFRLRLHAAWHLGKDKKCRKALMKEFREIYDWRSSVVHTGKLPKKKVSQKKRRPYTEEEVVKFIARAQDLCRKSIIKIMEEGQFPNWNDLILDGEAESDAVALGENLG